MVEEKDKSKPQNERFLVTICALDADADASKLEAKLKLIVVQKPIAGPQSAVSKETKRFDSANESR